MLQKCVDASFQLRMIHPVAVYTVTQRETLRKVNWRQASISIHGEMQAVQLDISTLH